MKRIMVDLNKLSRRELRAFLILKKAEERLNQDIENFDYAQSQQQTHQQKQQPQQIGQPLPQFKAPPEYTSPKKEKKKGFLGAIFKKNK